VVAATTPARQVVIPGAGAVGNQIIA
jgi:hypothetical protein